MFTTFLKSTSIATGLLLANQYLLPGSRRRSQPKCCGIIAYLGVQPRAAEVVLNGVDLLQNRGYDSAGNSSIFLIFRNLHHRPGKKPAARHQAGVADPEEY